MKTGIVLSVLIVALMSIPSKEAWGQTFFKCKDKSGRIIFSDHACPSGHTEEKITLPPVNSADHSYYRNHYRDLQSATQESQDLGGELGEELGAMPMFSPSDGKEGLDLGALSNSEWVKQCKKILEILGQGWAKSGGAKP
jgi:hypothetical protein